MSKKIHLYLGLPRLTDTKDIVDILEVDGATIGQCLDQLARDFPEVRKGLYDEKGKMLDRIDIWVNDLPAYSDGLERPVKDGDEIYLFASKLVIGGG